MAKVKLTAAGVKALETEKVQEEVWDELLPGFGVRVGRGGTKTYVVRYRANGKYRRYTLGRYPALSLADARKRARKKLAAAQDGEDPALERKTLRRKDSTFEAMAREVLDTKAETTRPSTRRERERILAAELLPVWGDRPAGSITRREVRYLAEGIAKRGAPVMANRTIALVKMLYNEALGELEFPGVEANPAHKLKPVRQEENRRRFLDRDEIGTVWRATEGENPVARGVFRLALLTAARVGSVCAMRWADVDRSDVWTIPPDVFKGRRAHAVPLSPEALAILADLEEVSGEGEYVFPGRTDGKRPHVTSMNKALARIRKRTGLPRWTIHDFRRTFRTWATRAEKPRNPKDPAGLGIAPHVADAALGHREASLGFDRYTGEPERYLLAEKREALRRWGAFVREAVEAGR